MPKSPWLATPKRGVMVPTVDLLSTDRSRLTSMSNESKASNKKSNVRRSRILAVLCSSLALAGVLTTPAWGRAGSGQSYHSSSSKSSSSSSSSSSRTSSSRTSSSNSGNSGGYGHSYHDNDDGSGYQTSAPVQPSAPRYVPIPVPVPYGGYNREVPTLQPTDTTPPASDFPNLIPAAATTDAFAPVFDKLYNWLVPLIIAVFFVILLLKLIKPLGASSSGGYSPEPDYQQLVTQDQSRMDQVLAHLRERDSVFDSQAFLERAGKAFIQIQDAWSKQDMRPARMFVSDGIMERFKLQIQWQQDDGVRNLMDNVQVLNASFLEVESDAHFDTLHVRIESSAEDSDVRISDGETIRQADGESIFVEVWSFLRRPGAKSLAHSGAIEGFCPSCGSPLKIVDTGQCEACKVVVNSGQYDWVLSEITQVSQWAVRDSAQDISGYKQLSAQDPSLNTQFLEDRVSVVFWRWIRALDQGEPGPLTPVATDDCVQAWTRDPDNHYAYQDVGVGSVEVQSFSQQKGLDQAEVLVKWSGSEVDRQDTDAGADNNEPRETVFTLVRRSGLKTDDSTGLRSSRCPSCGAATNDLEMPQCEYCGTHLNDPARHWVVSAIVAAEDYDQPEEPEAPGIIRDEAA